MIIITDEMVERAARTLYELDPFRPPEPFEELSSYYSEYYKKCARAVLEAALSGTTPMTDIVGLISKLHYWRGYGYSTITAFGWEEVKADLAKAADALDRLLPKPAIIASDSSRITLDRGGEPCPTCGFAFSSAIETVGAPALPDEIARLIERLSRIDEAPFSVNDCHAVRKAAAALRALAQENERIKTNWRARYSELEEQATDQRERIHELKAERDYQFEEKQKEFGRAENAITERDAIRAKTIEQAIKVFREDSSMGAISFEKRLRALAQMDEGKTGND